MLSLLLTLLLSHVVFSVSYYNNIPDYEVDALRDLYISANGTNWVWTGGNPWDFSQENPNPCAEEWKGVVCANFSGVLHVDTLNLQWSNLVGLIPSSIGNFSEITELQLDSNKLVGSLPSELGKLLNLSIFTVISNKLSGTVPSEIVNCLKLTEMNLFSNSFQGSIPPGVINMTSMESFQIGLNHFTGSLDFAEGFMNTIVYFMISMNHFNGTIPDFFCTSPTLVEFYLDYNHLRGPLPSCWSDSTPWLSIITFESNYFTGSLPYEFSNLPKLSFLNVGSNLLGGHIPPELSLVWGLQTLMLRDNSFSGPLPSNLSSLIRLQTIDLSDNLLSGWLPEDIGSWSSLTSLLLFNNHFSGPFPASITNLTSMNLVFLAYNHFTGSLPENFGALKKIGQFDLSYNQFSGSLPSSMGSITSITVFDLEHNQFTGPIYEGIGNYHKMSQCVLNDNLLSGTIPTGIGMIQAVVVLLLNNNLLSGTVPSLIGLASVDLVFLYSNMLTGSLENVLDCATQRHLMYVDVSNNQLSSSLPAALFSCPNLRSFAAVTNCFHGSLPLEMCSATNLTSLVLDGLLSASSCQKRFFANFDAVVSYGLSSRIPDGIPECLFSLPLLETLHLSGNGLTGTLSPDLELSPSLMDLSLSHNALRGSIPDSIRYHVWSELDLSYNKLEGTLMETRRENSLTERFMIVNASLSLKVNRLSGGIPSALKHLENIAILDGNIFECDSTRSSLPPDDPEYQIYSCGSNSFNYSIYFWLAVVSCAVLVCVVLWMLRLQDLTNAKIDGGIVSSAGPLWIRLSLWFSVWSVDSRTAEFTHIKSFGLFVVAVRRVFTWLTVFIVCILLPTYLALSSYFDTYTYEYAWSVSAAYLSGVTPAVVLLLLLLLFCILSVWSIYCHCQILHDLSSDPEAKKSNRKMWLHSATLLAVVVWNLILVTGVNIAYVYIDHNYNSTIVQITQLSVALFKVCWNNSIVQYVLERQNNDQAGKSHRMSLTDEDQLMELRNSKQNVNEDGVCLVHKDSECGRNIGLAVFVMLFNNIAAPFIATGYVSSDCFYDIFTTPARVKVTYQYAQCLGFVPLLNHTFCESYNNDLFHSIDYYPPFLYSYQCASTFITTYANIFILMMTIDSFLIPVLMWTMKSLHERVGKHPSGVVYQFLDKILPLLLQSLDNLGSKRNNTLVLFKCDVFVVKLINLFAILCTFGAILPPVAVICCVAVFSVTYQAQLMIGRFVTQTRSTSVASTIGLGLCSVLDRDCRGAVDMFLNGVHMAVPFVVVFYGLILFDTLGDAVGWQRALCVPLLLCVLPVIAYTAIGYCKKSKVKGDVMNSELSVNLLAVE